MTGLGVSLAMSVHLHVDTLLAFKMQWHGNGYT